MKVIDLFAGVGGWSTGARAAGHEVVAAVEYDQTAAEYYARNHGPHVICADILSVNPGDMPAAEILLASPPCPNFSIAKAGGKETEHDITLARKVAEFVTVLRPRFVFLENVYAYRKSQSWAIVQDALTEAGYWHDLNHLNAADFGVPQTRKRMIVRAGLSPLPLLPQKLPWVGWYAAIEDILHTLPESEFAPWQLARLPEDWEDVLDFLYNSTDSGPEARHNPRSASRKLKAFLLGGANTAFADAKHGRGLRHAHEPAHSVTAASGGRGGRAFLVSGQNGSGKNSAQQTLTLRASAAPSFTVSASAHKSMPTAFMLGSQNANAGRTASIRMPFEPGLTVTATATKGQSRVWLSRGRVVSMSPHALARFQSFPDSTIWPEGKSAATRLIGNAVPPLMAQALLKDLK